jgi:protease II
VVNLRSDLFHGAIAAVPFVDVVTTMLDETIPAKWVARLRDHHVGDNQILLKTNMEAGHGGAAGRSQRWREIAFEYAWLLGLAGLDGGA